MGGGEWAETEDSGILQLTLLMDNVVKAEDLSIFPPAAYDMRTLPRTAPQVLQLKYNFYLNDSHWSHS